MKDRESVVVKSDGSYTYFANDIAYHNLKFENSPDLVVDVWGANHHGHVPRIKAAIASLGHETSKFHVILYQWVRFKRGSEIVKMSKRSGTFITAREVLDEIGPDALRFFILMYDPNSHIDFDLDLAKERSNKNPVYYVQYAHARIASILTKVPNVNLESRTPVILERSDRISKKRSYRSFHSLQDDNANYQLLTTNYELSLIKQITRLPELVEDIASNFAVHRLTAYSIDLADSFHKFYENCPVLSDDKELTEARIALISATKIALANTLRLLGVSAPQKM
ncbi:class I tRNA ligase family protein [Candidatus Curtissbacteria bacterium]|nr:class I tRNA ligase family protein [Candidatus Curtissbacteria bacterium]